MMKTSARDANFRECFLKNCPFDRVDRFKSHVVET
jgi:hypothetical protein